MTKPISELLDYLAEKIEYLENELSDVDIKEEPSTYWYVFSGIRVYKSVAKEVEENYLQDPYRVSGPCYSWVMEKHEVVNEILDYLDTRRTQLSNEMAAVAYESNDYAMLDAMYEVYDHLVTKLEDDYR